MSPLRRRVLLKVMMVGDLLVVATAVLAAAPVALPASPMSPGRFFAIRVSIATVLVVVTVLAAWHLVLARAGLYGTRRLATVRADVTDVVRATTLGTLFTVAAAAALDPGLVTPAFVAILWISTTAAIVSGRVVLRRGLQWARRHGRNLRRVLIVGTNARAVQCAARLESRPELGYTVIGFVDEAWPGAGPREALPYPVVAAWHDFPAFLRRQVVDEVFICLPLKSLYTVACDIAAAAEEQGVVVRFVPTIFDPRIGRLENEALDELAVMTVYTGALRGWRTAVKRTADVVLASVLLAALAPLLAAAALAIKLDAPGPVLFAQDRLGLNKRRFRLYKFRTMVADAERRLDDVLHLNEASGPVFKIADDPRITAVGRVLRKTSIDELPQLVNVLTGDMSLVGPRPLPVRDYEGFSEDWHRRRFSVRPGITCLWQVNGRSAIPFQRWMELDLHYIDHWSLWLDLRILLKTIPAVLRGAGAS